MQEDDKTIQDIRDELGSYEDNERVAKDIYAINYQKKVLIICAIVFAIFFIIIFFFYKFLFTNSKIPKLSIENTLQGAVSTITGNINKDKKQIFEEIKPWYEVKIEYPSENINVKNNIFEIYNGFASETNILKYDDVIIAKKELNISDDMKYSFDAKYRNATSSNSKSYIYEIYTFTGGAHGSTVLIAYSQDAEGKSLDIENILPIKILPEISKIAAAIISKEKEKRMLASGMSLKEAREVGKNDEFLKEGVTPTRDNYSSAWYEGEELVIHFGQYQVASYAEGMFEVRIPKSKINEIKAKYNL